MKQVKLHAEVRFHLGKGEHFRHWQIKVMRGRKKVDEYYYDPNEYQLEMRGCRLVNQLARAKWVHKKQKKNVSGWVRCEEVILTKESPIDNLEKLYYNPIKDIRWRREGDCGEFSWDDSQYETLITQGKQVYILEERT